MPHLDGGLDALRLDEVGLVDAQLAHVRELARVAVHTPGSIAGRCVLGAQGRQRPDCIRTAVLDQSAGDNLKRLPEKMSGKKRKKKMRGGMGKRGVRENST